MLFALQALSKPARRGRAGPERALVRETRNRREPRVCAGQTPLPANAEIFQTGSSYTVITPVPRFCHFRATELISW